MQKREAECGKDYCTAFEACFRTCGGHDDCRATCAAKSKYDASCADACDTQ
jgi:hypothetical protein